MGDISDFVLKSLHLSGTQAVQDHFDKPPQPSYTQPGTLGTGVAQQAANTIKTRTQTINDAVDAASQ